VPADPYAPEEHIAVGPSGKIYRGRGIASKRVVRIKALLGARQVPCPVDRAIVEATLPYVLNLEHSQIARLLDIDFDADDFAIVSEYSPGTSGVTFLHQRKLMTADVRAIASQILLGLTAGEIMGTHHGDVKLSNIIIARHEAGGGWSVQLQDWGFSACRKRQPEETMLFRAPERFEGDDASSRADLFSMGVALVSLLVGHVPIIGNTAEELTNAWRTFDPRALRQHRPDVAPAFLDWLAWLLRFDPGQRPASAQQAQEALMHTGTSAFG
jgi:serine/threonine-protein kinase